MQGGVIRGIGMQSKVIVTVLVCYYVIGIPIAAGLSFKTELALRGIWIGIACAGLAVNIMFATLISKARWEIFT